MTTTMCGSVLRADNGEKILKSEGYASEAGAKKAIDTVVTTSLIAEWNDEDGVDQLPAYVIFEGVDGQFYWRLQAGNGEIVAVGGEGFSSKSAARASIELVKAHANDEISCWTNEELSELKASDGAAASGTISGVVADVFIGEMDPFVVGDTCITYIDQDDGGLLVGVLQDFDMCEEPRGEVSVSADSLRAVSAAEDEILQDFQPATYFWLEGTF